MRYPGNKALRGRILIAVLFVPIFVALLLLGGLPFLVLITAVAAVGVVELYRSSRISSRFPLKEAVLAALFPVIAYFGGELALVMATAVVILAYFSWNLFALQLNRLGTKVFAGIGSLLYVGFFLGFVVLTRQIPLQGTALATSLLLATWMGDTGAYTVGTRWGRHFLLPTYSSRKSWEGFFGALLFSLAAMVISRLWLNIALCDILILGLLIGGIGQMGDLFESALKRSLAIKDFGQFLLGHGGILDRFDSLLFTAPVFFFYVKYVARIGG